MKKWDRGIDYRTLSIASYMLENRCTLREAEKVFGVCKSVIHRDMTDRLRLLDYDMYLDIRELLDNNKKERAYRASRARGIVCLEKENKND